MSKFIPNLESVDYQEIGQMLSFIKESMQQINEASGDEKDFAQVGDIFNKYLKLRLKK